MATHPVRIEDWLQLIRAEFDEPFGLRLTAAEAADRWAPLDRVRVTAILNALTDSGYLRCSADGMYVRRADDDREVSQMGVLPSHRRATAHRLH